jgi:hypothetical protein
MSSEDELEVLRGRIESLAVAASEEEFLQTGSVKAVGAVAANALALAGMAGAASGALMATTGSADAVQIFTCSLGGERISGRFSIVDFSNGDEVDVAGVRQKDGSLLAYAIRRPGDKKIWMYPHCSRGSKAHWKHAWKMVVVITTAFFISFGGFFSLGLDAEEIAQRNAVFWFAFWVVFINSIVIGLYFPLRTALRFRPSVAMAEKIFAALGYADPANVDMEKQNSRYWRENDGQYEANRWVYRYME